MLRMLRKVVCGGLLLSGLVSVPSVLRAQEATTMNGTQAVRFEQGPGFYHYVAFCRTPKEFTTQMPAPKVAPDNMEYALCWYVNGAKADASRAGGDEADGRIVVSEHHVRFVPRNPEASSLYIDLPREQVELKHDPGQAYATVQGKGQAFRFRFSKLCLTCAPGTATPPGVVPALLDHEFGLLDETIRRYTTGWREIYRLSSGVPAKAPSRSEAARLAASDGSRPGPAPGRAEKTNAAEANRMEAPAVRKPAPAAASPSAVALRTAAPATAPGSVVIGGPKGKPVKIASGAADGLLVKKIAPDYPLEAKLVRLEGTVVVRAVIDKAGEVSEVSALSGPPLLESAAVDAVKQWQYRPFSQNGQPVDVETTIAVVFALDGSRGLRSQSARR